MGGFDPMLLEPGEYHEYTPAKVDGGWFSVKVSCLSLRRRILERHTAKPGGVRREEEGRRRRLVLGREPVPSDRRT